MFESLSAKIFKNNYILNENKNNSIYYFLKNFLFLNKNFSINHNKIQEDKKRNKEIKKFKSKNTVLILIN